MTINNDLERFKAVNKKIEEYASTILDGTIKLVVDKESELMVLQALSEVGYLARSAITDIRNSFEAMEKMKQIFEVMKAQHRDEEKKFGDKVH